MTKLTAPGSSFHSGYSLPDFEQFRVLVDDVHQDPVDVAAELRVHLLLVLQSRSELFRKV